MREEIPVQNVIQTIPSFKTVVVVFPIIEHNFIQNRVRKPLFFCEVVNLQFF